MRFVDGLPDMTTKVQEAIQQNIGKRESVTTNERAVTQFFI
jgi:hypothetical protein